MKKRILSILTVVVLLLTMGINTFAQAATEIADSSITEKNTDVEASNSESLEEENVDELDSEQLQQPAAPDESDDSSEAAPTGTEEISMDILPEKSTETPSLFAVEFTDQTYPEFFTNVEMIHTNGQTNGENNSWTQWDKVSLKYQFDFGYPAKITGDDKYTFQLPDEFKSSSSNHYVFQITAFDYISGENVPFADVTVRPNGSVTMDFAVGKAFIASRDDIKGFLTISVLFSEDFKGQSIDFGHMGQIDLNYTEKQPEMSQESDHMVSKSSAWYDFDRRIISWNAKGSINQDLNNVTMYDSMQDGKHVFYRYTQEIDDSIPLAKDKWSTYGWNENEHGNKDVVLLFKKDPDTKLHIPPYIIEITPEMISNEGIISFSVPIGAVQNSQNADGSEDGNEIQVRYYTQAIDYNQTSYFNKVKFTSDEGAISSGGGIDVTANGGASGTAYQVDICKLDKDTRDIIKFESGLFSLYKENANGEWVRLPDISMDSSGIMNLYLTRGLYKIIELEAPNGYVLSSDEFLFTVDGTTNPLQIEISNVKSATTEITVQKRWVNATNDFGDQNSYVEVDIWQIDESNQTETPYTVLKVFKKNGWTASLNNLPVQNKLGHPVTYRASERTQLDHYVSNVLQNNPGVFEITNTEVINISGIKTWEDNHNFAGKRPSSITVILTKDGLAVDGESQTVTPDKNDIWSYHFTDLPKYDEHGQEIQYNIREEAVTDYESTISGYNLTNTYKPESEPPSIPETVTTSVTGTKKWTDDNNRTGKRPDNITVILYADGKEIQTKIVTENDEWSYTFSELDKYGAGGELITYTIGEKSVNGYRTVIKGYDIENIYTPAPPSVVPQSINKTLSPPKTGDKGFLPYICINLISFVLILTFYFKKGRHLSE